MSWKSSNLRKAIVAGSLLGVLLGPARAGTPSSYAIFNHEVEVSRAADPREVRELNWFQAASVELYVRIWVTNAVPDLSATNVLYIWTARSATNDTQTYLLSTGVVEDADLGRLKWTLSPAEANLPTGLYYGLVRALELENGTNVVRQGFIEDQIITVRFADDSRYLDVVGPLTYPPVVAGVNDILGTNGLTFSGVSGGTWTGTIYQAWFDALYAPLAAWTNHTNSASAHHTRYTDAEARNAVTSTWPNIDRDSSDDFSGAWGSLTGVPAGFADDTDNTNDAIASVGDVSNAAKTAWANLDTDKTDDLAPTNAPPWTAIAQDAGGTATVTRTGSKYFVTRLTGPGTLNVRTADWTTNDSASFRWDIWAGTNSVSFPTSIWRNTGPRAWTNLSFSSTTTTVLLINMPWLGDRLCDVLQF